MKIHGSFFINKYKASLPYYTIKCNLKFLWAKDNMIYIQKIYLKRGRQSGFCVKITKIEI